MGYEVVSVRRERGSREGYRDDQVSIARCLGMIEGDVQALADYINDNPGIFLRGAEWRDDQFEEEAEPIRRLYCSATRGHPRVFGALSGGETSAVLMDLAIARARILAVCQRRS
jgi:hypothetical protein